MNELPNRIQNGYQPMFEGDTFKFECRSDLRCFTRCCRNADMYLYPYDIIRMKNRLNVTSDCFLAQHTFTAFRDNPYFPSVMLRMSDADGHACHFLTDDGCMIYEDRPISCRTYPLERAVARTGTNENRMDCYFIARHAYCLGHNETRKWTVEEWIEDQRIQKYNAMNNLWVEIDTLFRSKPWRERELNNPALKMAFMACFNVDRFKVFVCESTFFSRFEVSPEKIERIMNSDVELMKLGFDWIKFFLRSTGPLKLKSGNTRFEETLQRHS